MNYSCKVGVQRILFTTSTVRGVDISWYNFEQSMDGVPRYDFEQGMDGVPRYDF